MRIDIKGAPFTPPEYATSLHPEKFTQLLIDAHDPNPDRRGRDRTIDQRLLLEKLAADPRKTDYAAAVIAEGNIAGGRYGSHSERLTSWLADYLDEEDGDMLELVPSQEGQSFQRRDKGTVSAVGKFLNRGLIAVQGNVGEIRAVRNGVVHVDGNVINIDQAHGGILYVGGDVGRLKETNHEVVVVAGKLHEFYHPMRSRGGMSRETPPSPMIFTTHPVEITGRDAHGPELPATKHPAVKIPDTMEIRQDRLEGWTPQETWTKALALTRERIAQYALALVSKAGEITDPHEMGKMVDKTINGYANGRSGGYYANPGDTIHVD